MAWQVLDPDDLLSVLTQPERDLFGQGDSASTSPDRLVAIVGWVIDQVRGKVAACAENRDVMGPSGTIPAELYGDAIVIARFQLLTSFPAGKAFLDEGRMRAYSDALKHLDDAAAGKLAIEPVATPDQFAPDAVGFGSRDDDIANPLNWCNRNDIDFGFWH